MNKELIFAAADLARSSPQTYQRFLAEYRVYLQKTIEDVVSSPPDQIFKAQGRALHAREVLSLLENCTRDAEQIQKVKSNVR